MVLLLTHIWMDDGRGTVDELIRGVVGDFFGVGV